MQRAIVEAAMAGDHVLGILPTGTGKSLCYQIPALSRYYKTGALTVVISPLVALMADQVAGLEAHGIGSCVAINGLLSMPERADALDRVRLGDAGILIISPEQLRNRSLRRALDQREILLLTAHRAKGLEFDHVAVLDGGWDKVDKGEDPDAPRRLYYVAMTRARQTLALVRFQGSRPAVGTTRPDFVKEPEPPVYSGRLYSLPYTFPNNGSILRRTSDGLQPETPKLSRQYRRPSLSEVNLGFAGRYHSNHPLHRAIAALSPRDQLETRIAKNGYWELLNRSGMVVGRLAQVFEPPPGTRCRSATVFAVVAWSREASEPQYHDSMKCDAWEVVVPELVFEPERE